MMVVACVRMSWSTGTTPVGWSRSILDMTFSLVVVLRTVSRGAGCVAYCTTVKTILVHTKSVVAENVLVSRTLAYLT